MKDVTKNFGSTGLFGGNIGEEERNSLRDYLSLSFSFTAFNVHTLNPIGQQFSQARNFENFQASVHGIENAYIGFQFRTHPSQYV